MGSRGSEFITVFNNKIRMAPYKDLKKEQERINLIAKLGLTDIPVTTIQGVKIPSTLKYIEEEIPSSFTEEQLKKLKTVGNRWTKEFDGKKIDRLYINNTSNNGSNSWKKVYLDLTNGEIIGGTSQMKKTAEQKIKDVLGLIKENPNIKIMGSESAASGFDLFLAEME